jgi:acetyl-CoA acetyltransferase
LAGLPIVNVENACASGSTAFNGAWRAVASGEVEVAVAVGAEKLTHEDKTRSFAALGAAVDQEALPEIRERLYGSDNIPAGRSMFMDIYASFAEAYAEKSGATSHDFALVAAKNHDHGALNPKAQYRNRVTPEEVLSSRQISGPLTLLMCSPIGDGAAALILVSEDMYKRLEVAPVKVAASILASGNPEDIPPVVRAARRAYAASGIGPEDIDVVELHDAAAPAELIAYEDLGLCDEGGGPALLTSGATTLGGRVPVNPSGGLLSRGHPVGATGCAQLVELTSQLRGECGSRQVAGARVALAENAGGLIGTDPAAASITILQR